MKPLTKSKYLLALDCPTKLYYSTKPEYGNMEEDDSFMAALAEGGYQVAELAKCYYPDGIAIKDKGYEIPLRRTLRLLEQENVVIFEAAIQFNNLFVRVDILEKKGNNIKLIEVKSKSYSGKDEIFLNKSGYISSGWSSYIEDVAFQKYVVQKAFKTWNVQAYLMMADKTTVATVNGLNQKFRIVKDVNNRASIVKNGDISITALGNHVVTPINVNQYAELIIADNAYKQTPTPPYEQKIAAWADAVKHDIKLTSPLGLHCLSCEYNTYDSKLISGFRECWSKENNWTDADYEKPTIAGIWNFRGKKKLFKKGIIFMEDVEPDDIGKDVADANGMLSAKERQWLQIEKVKNGDSSFYLDTSGMSSMLNSFTYPLHFIDFETSMVAIPFYEGQRPYEQVAFQFSHHIMYSNGKVEHIGEHIETEKGKFPNSDFLRALKRELENDNGTIFRYAAHENTVLNQICDQLYGQNLADVPDKEELIEFIHSITYSNNEDRVGERNMVDMLEMVRAYYYVPAMGGSNSIKSVLPAVLNSSKFIQEKYRLPIYGKNSPIKSLNFEDGWRWVRYNETGEVLSPYKLLPPLFDDLSDNEIKDFVANESLADGGAAMVAFAKMQFTDMTDAERERIIKGLLKYCELDTLAMVMIFEFWKWECKQR